MRNIAWGFCLLLLSSFALGAPGEEWSYQGQFEMMGMKMPMKPVVLCVALDEPKTPPLEGECSYKNITTEGATTRFEFACTGDDESSGTGSTTITGNTLKTEYTLNTADGSGKVVLAGKKGRSCDTSQSAIIDGKSVDEMKQKMEP